MGIICPLPNSFRQAALIYIWELLKNCSPNESPTASPCRLSRAFSIAIVPPLNWLLATGKTSLEFQIHYNSHDLRQADALFFE
jgi:hypothetical protein